MEGPGIKTIKKILQSVKKKVHMMNHFNLGFYIASVWNTQASVFASCDVLCFWLN